MDGLMVSGGAGTGRDGAELGLALIVGGETGGGLIEVMVPRGASVRVLVEVVAARGGYRAEEAFVFVDDADEPLVLDVVIDDAHPHHKRHHVHRHREVEVTVNYAAGRATRLFSPATRIERVLRWAVGQFPQIDGTLATELELKVAPNGPELPAGDHLGQHVPFGEGRIELDLTRGIIANGASS